MFVADAGGGRVLVVEIGAGGGASAGLPPRPAAALAVGGSPYGVAANATGHLFVSDPASGRVAVLGPGGEPAGELPAGPGAGTMDWPAGVAVGPDGRVYVAERNAGRVLVFGAGGGAGGEPAAISQAGPAGRLLAPAGVAVGGSGELYVADAAADAVHVFGPGGLHLRTIEVPPLGGARGSPHGVAVDPRSGTLYVASLLQGALHAYGASGEPAAAPAALAPRQGAAPDAAQPRPLSVAVRGDGLLLVADAANGRAVLAHPNGTVHSVAAGRPAGGAGIGAPFAPADAAAGPGPGGAAYVADAGSGTVSAYAPGPPGGPPRVLWTSAGGGGGAAGVAVDGSGRVIVSGSGAGGGIEVRALSAADGSPAGAPYAGGGAGSGRPAGVAAGPSGEVAVADPAAGAVRLVGAGGSPLGAIAGLDDPVDVAFTPGGSVVVAERGAHAVREFGAGPGGWASPGPARTVASFGLGDGGVFMPEAVAVDGGGRIIVADSGGAAAQGPRVQVFDYAGRPVSRIGGGWEGAAYGAPAGLGAAARGGTVLLAGPAAGGSVRALAALDSDAPAVASLGIAWAGGARTLGPYAEVAANVTFTEPVVVRTAPRPAASAGAAGEGAASPGPPTLALGIAGGGGRAALASDEFCGPGNGTASYSSGNGTASLLFAYTVLPGERAAALGRAPAGPVAAGGSSITDLAGNRAALSMPAAQGGPTAGPAGAVEVNGSAGAFLPVGLLVADASAADSRAAGLAACDLNREAAAAGSSGPFLALAAVEAPGALDADAPGNWADRRAAGALGALRDSHGGGRGPSMYVTTLPDEALATPAGPMPNSTAVGYADGRGLLLVATAASSAPSLSASGGGNASGGMLYRAAAGGAHLAHALSAAIGPEIDVLLPIVQTDAFGEPAPARGAAAPFSHGLYGLVLGHLRDAGGIVDGFDAGLLNYDRTRRAEFNFTAPHGGWGPDAAALDLNLALLKGQVGDGRAAVLYLGSAAEYVRLAEAAAGLPALSGTRWLAAGGVAASPLVEESAAASSLAASTGLEAVAFGVGGGGVRGAAAGSAVEGYEAAAAAARVDSVVGPAQGEAARAYSAYDAVQVLGRAAALAAEAAGGGADGEGGGGIPAAAVPSARAVSLAMGDAALAYRGALGNVRLDAATGDLDLPITHDVWRMGPGGWERASVKRGIDSCSVSLAAPDLDFGPVKARAASAPARQSIANTGTLELVGVALSPGEWSAEGGEGPPLPARLTEYVDESAPAARFAPAAGGPSGAAVVARGLEPAEESGLLLRLNLRAVQSLGGAGEMSQAMTYTASCDWRAAAGG